jgi:hypothetical protein
VVFAEAELAAARSQFLNHPYNAAEAELYISAGIPVNAFSRAPAGIFLVTENVGDALRLRSESDVYKATARNIASTLLDHEAKTDLFNYVTPGRNAPQFVRRLDASRVGDPHHYLEIGPSFRNPVYGTGFASLSVGTEVFSLYAAERLARRAVDLLTAGHMDHATGPNDDPQQLVRDRVTARQVSFFRDCGLHEVGDTNNQVLDALFNGDVDSTLEGVAQKLYGVFQTSNTQALAEPRTGDEWQDFIMRRNGSSYAEQAAAETATLAVDNCQKWADSVQTKVADTVAAYVAEEGIPVTLALLNALTEQLGAAANSLEVEKEQQQAGFRTQGQNAVSALKGASAALDRTASEVTAALDSLLGMLRAQSHMKARTIAIKLLNQVEVSVVARLAAQLDQVQTNIATDLAVRGPNSTWALINSWPIGNDVPEHLHPMPNQLLLINHEEFPATFDSLMVGTTNEASPQWAERRAAGEVISGAFKEALMPVTSSQDLVHVTGWTVSGTVDGRSATFDSSAADVAVSFGRNVAAGQAGGRVTPQALLDRAGNWTRTREGEIRNFVDTSLEQYLVPADAPDKGRINVFQAKFASMLQWAQPSLALNSTALTGFHGQNAPAVAWTSISPLPDLQDAEETETMRAALANEGVPANAIASALDGDCSKSQQITAFTRFDMPVDALTTQEVADTVQREWRIGGGLAGYSRLRRTRPLPAAVPLTPDTMRAMSAGWFIGHFFGWIHFPAQLGAQVQAFGTDGAGAEPVRITSRENDQEDTPQPEIHLAFPSPFLGGPAVKSNVLAGVLQSFPLALYDLAYGNDETVRAYEQLAQFGFSLPNLEYPFLNALFQGFRPAGMELREDFFEPTLGQKDRIDLFATALHDQKPKMQMAPAPATMRVDDTLTVDRRWELREVSLDALDRLAKVVDQWAAEAARGSTTDVM